MLRPDEALERLMNGNKRYASSTQTRPNQDALRRAEVANGQDPFAIVVGCSDSRVPVEVIFDVGVGDLFVIRTAGNLMEDVCIASVEFGVAVLGIRLVMVMGHLRCGAVGSAVEATLNKENRIPASSWDDESAMDEPRSFVDGLVDKIRPAVDNVRHLPGDLLDNAIRANAEMMVCRMRDRSSIINGAEKSGKLQLLSSVYDLDAGLVVLNPVNLDRAPRKTDKNL